MLLACLLTFLGAALIARLSISFNQERELLLVIATLILILSFILAPGLVKLALLGLVMINQQLNVVG
ncbi:MAG: hypothetical protein AB4058_09485 [Microcystaceae cyanobacterium]